MAVLRSLPFLPSFDAAFQRLAVRWIYASIWWWAAGAALAQPLPKVVEWDVLRPPAVAETDPFAGLPDAQLDALTQLVRLDAAMAAGTAGQGSAERLAALRQQRLQQRQALLAQAVAVDDLLAARLSLIEQRRAQAEHTGRLPDGESVTITGYLLPVPALSTTATTAAAEYLLLPWLGACSHTPPPPPNQVIRLSGIESATALDARQRVRVTGKLRVQRQVLTLNLVDGEVSVRSAYAVQGARIEVLAPTAFAAPFAIPSR